MPSNPQETRARVLTELRARGIHVNSSLPLLDDAKRTDSKGPVRVGKRMAVLYALTGLAHEADPKKLLAWLSENGLGGELLPSEHRLFTKRSLSKQEEIDVSWKQESLYTLSWSVRLVAELEWPTDQCNLARLFPRIPPEVSVEQFLQNIDLREEGEIYYQTDLHYCLHWFLRHPEVWDDAPAIRSVKKDVVLERRTALEWLIGTAEEWDDVSLDT